jgi:hypothetical protein
MSYTPDPEELEPRAWKLYVIILDSARALVPGNFAVPLRHIVEIIAFLRRAVIHLEQRVRHASPIAIVLTMES